MLEDITIDDKYDMLVGKIIRYCQCIELDIKLIYSGMREGDMNDNYLVVEKDTLGVIVNKLRVLDNSDNNPFLTKNDYKILSTITSKRNYWAHEGHLDYVYDAANKELFKKQFIKLTKDEEVLQDFHRKIEKLRLSLMKMWGYI